MGRKTMGAEKADCPLQRALETAWNPKLVHDHANPLRSSRYEPVVYHLISMLNPADPQNLENFDPTRFSRHRPQAPLSILLGSEFAIDQNPSYHERCHS